MVFSTMCKLINVKRDTKNKNDFVPAPVNQGQTVNFWTALPISPNVENFISDYISLIVQFIEPNNYL
jgi:hypothetical protein